MNQPPDNTLTDTLDDAARAGLGDWLYQRLVATLDYTGDAVTVAEIVEGAREGRYQIFQHGQAAVEVTQRELSYEGDVLNLLYSAGDLRALVEHVLPMLVAYGTETGCVALVATGRKGWRRFASKNGFEISGERFVRYLPNKEEN